MTKNQIKSAIAKFKSADVSIIKDDAMRAKAQKLQAKQKGFTLLELLVVITLLATLATAALVAYDGIGENARDASAATAVTALEGTLRNYRGVVGEYPEQFDNLANIDGIIDDGATPPVDIGAMELMSDKTKAFFGQLVFTAAQADGAAGLPKLIFDSLRETGLEELQSVQSGTTWNNGFVPNLAMNESYPEVATLPGSEVAFTDLGAMTFDDKTIAVNTFANVAISIVPSGGASAADVTAGDASATGCQALVAGDLQSAFDASTVSDNKRLNLISDGLESNGCDLVVALGVGKEVPGATLGQPVEISQVPTVGTNDVNPKTNYARAIALFHVGQDGSDGTLPDGAIGANEIFTKARLVAVVDPEGRAIGQIAAAAISDATVD